MILLVNIGNTNLTYGIHHTNIIASERYPITDLPDQNCIENLYLSLMKRFHVSTEQIEGVVLSSVVPEKTTYFVDVLRQFLSIEPTVISDRTAWGFDRSEYFGLLGVDRLLCCKAALQKYQPPLIVIDCGTATTINVINKAGDFAGGVILPGVVTGMQALSTQTSLLQSIEITNPKNVIGKNTAECMLSGAIYGHTAQIEGLTARIAGELGTKAAVIITGGNSEAIIPHCNIALKHEPDLLLEGLAIIYEERNTV
jgi:type III pantothenate kinase